MYPTTNKTSRKQVVEYTEFDVYNLNWYYNENYEK